MGRAGTRVWVVGLLLATPLVAGRSEAAPSTHTWTFTATHSATTTITVPRGVRVLAPALVNRIALRQDPPSKLIDTKGSFGGIVIRDRHDVVIYAVLRYKAFVLLPEWGHDYSIGDDSVALPAGSYRVSVLGNAKTTVRLPISGAPDRSAAVKGEASVHSAEYASPNLPAETASLPLPLKTSSTFLTAAWVYTGPMLVPTRADYQYICFSGAEEASGVCVNKPGGGGGFTGIASEAEEMIWAGATTREMGFQPGAYVANLERADAGTPTQARGFITVVLD